jgi:hypothetical protein
MLKLNLVALLTLRVVRRSPQSVSDYLDDYAILLDRGETLRQFVHIGNFCYRIPTSLVKVNR